MRRILHARLLASALAVSVLPVVASIIPAQAQMYGEVSFDSFHDQLAQYGYWGYSDRWGLVWQPGNVPDDFRPYYTAGHWDYTDDYGWFWDSAFPWGDIAFHYGRWVDDPEDGWLWIPGYTWSPGWVVWRSNGQYVGWMPAPPDQGFLGYSVGFGGLSFSWGGDPYYGYRNWYGRDFDERRFADNWTFVGFGHMADRDYRRVVVSDPRLVVNLIHRTRDMSHSSVANGYVVNRGIDVRLVQRAAGHPIQTVQARSVIRRPELIMRADAGERIRMHERMVSPRGNGLANSAPPPPQSVVDKLSTQSRQRNGQPPTHLYSKSTIANPEAQSRFHGNWPGRGQGGMGGPGTPPNGGMDHRDQGQSANPDGMNGPAGNGNPSGPDYRHRDQGQSGNPGGMNGPGGTGNGSPSGPDYRHRDQGQSGNPGGMSGPNGADTGTPSGGEPRHRDQGQSGGPGSANGAGPGSSGGMSGPTGQGDQSAPSGEHHHRSPSDQGGMTGPGGSAGTGGMTGPSGQTGGPPHRTPPVTTQAPATPPADQTPPPPEKKKHKPDQPPGAPQN